MHSPTSLLLTCSKCFPQLFSVSSQARMQEMKWGVFFVKKWTFPQRRVHYVQYQYFLFYILLIWGECIHTQHTPACLQAWFHAVGFLSTCYALRCVKV